MCYDLQNPVALAEIDNPNLLLDLLSHLKYINLYA